MKKKDLLIKIPQEGIESKILLIRSQKVMLDRDLAELYEVEVKHLKRQVRRNIDRFPEDFMFVLTKEEYKLLRSHFGTLKRGEHSKYLPYEAKGTLTDKVDKIPIEKTLLMMG